MTDEQLLKARITAAGYLPWAMDLSGNSYQAPDGIRVVTLEQAIEELDNREAKK